MAYNGCRFENKTSLKKFLINKGTYFNNTSHFYTFNIENNIHLKTIHLLENKSVFIYLKDIIEPISKAHGCIRPDELLINKAEYKVLIIEKKYQNVKGSACEKIQAGIFKKWYFEKLFKNYKVYYAYSLSNWFKHNCMEEINYLQDNGITIFYGEEDEYFEKIVKFIKDIL